MARAFAAKGRDLALCARRTDRLDELKTELSQRYPNVKVTIAALDVNDHEQVPKVFAELSDALGGIDRVIVNAGIGKGARLGSGKLWANKATIETNLVAALVQIETALQMFKEQGSGHLVLISSVLGAKGVPGVKAAYAASKAAVASLTQTLAVELARTGVNVNALAPGVFPTPLNASLIQGTPRGEEILMRTPMGRFGEARELAGAAIFLASEAASFVTGEVLAVDGGYLASGVNR